MGDLDTSPPLVSVVITTYNRPELLPQAVESVRNQTYENLEIIVVDDCSDKPAVTLLADGPDLRIFRHDENRGANAARNTGIEASSGEFLAFLDDDDTWHPTKLEKQVAAFGDDDEIVMVYTGSQSINADGDVISRFNPRIRGDVTTDLFGRAHIGGFSLVMVRRSAIAEAGNLDERFPSWQDREWYVRLSLVGRFEYVDAPLVTHRSPEDQISRDFEQKRDVSYPLFLEKHRPLAASYAPKHERMLVASLSHSLGASALYSGHYREAVRSLARSLWMDPLRPRTVAYLLLALGGAPTFKGAQRIKHEVISRLVGSRS